MEITISIIIITAIISGGCGIVAGIFIHRFISGLKTSDSKEHISETKLNNEEQDYDNFQFPLDIENDCYQCKKIVKRNE